MDAQRSYFICSRGFTLIEILVVLSLFGLIGIMTAQVVARTAQNNNTLTIKGDRLSEIHLAMQIIQRDIVQIASRPIRDELGDPLPALRIGADGLIEFTRTGWRNPLLLQRSELQRVAYIVQDGDLYRAYWTVLDRAGDSEPTMQKLLSQVEDIEFFAIDLGGEEYTFWPRPPDDQTKSNRDIAGIIIRAEIQPLGVIERVWQIPIIQ